MASFRLDRWIAAALLSTAVFPAALSTAGCDGAPVVPADTGTPVPDAGPPVPVSIAHCAFEAVPPTGGSGGSVATGALMAGTAEDFLDVPLGASLAAYTDRAEGAGRSGFLPPPDERRTELAGSFAPSVGVETAPRIRALALSAGGETVVILKVDLASSYQGFVHDVEAALGPQFSGKVIVTSSHSHNSFGNYSGHSALHVGFGRFRRTVYDRIVAQLTATAQAAIAALEPAQIGFAYDANFDPENRVNRDRRGENDVLAGGSFDDHHLFVIRVDTAAGEPMAIIPTFGIHGTLSGGDNPLASTDSIGGIERVLEESFDRPVLVMHAQGAGGDVSPAGTDTLECGGAELCSDFGRAETIGLYALDAIRAAWTQAGTAMQTDLAIEMITRNVPLGPDWETFTIRDGALRYAPWDGRTRADGIVYGADGMLASPIDEFNAPFGAALCGGGDDFGLRLPRSTLPGTEGLNAYSYYNCNRIEQIETIIEISIGVEFEMPPLCQTTQTTVSALRLGDWLIGTLPGEPVTLLVDHLRTLSPVPPERTIVWGYTQDHVGYLLRPEDWLAGGYEPSITFWGPLEGEYITEQTAAMMELATTDAREDGIADGIDRAATPMVDDMLTTELPSAGMGTVPATLPTYILTRLLRPVTSAQPAAQIERLETVFFTWIGDDVIEGTPRVTLQRETAPGVFEDVLRQSGRAVQDADFILTWTPDPIFPVEGAARTHYFTVEFQAVAPMGMPGLETLADRVGLPLGNYRFRVEAPTYELTSAPFEVVPAQLEATATAMGSDVAITLGALAPQGFRVIDLAARSNQLVPLRSSMIDVVVRRTAGDTPSSVSTDADGNLTVPGASDANEIVLTDRFGNTATVVP